MSAEFRSLKRTPGSHSLSWPLSWLVGCALAAGMMSGMGSPAYASIVLPAVPDFSLPDFSLEVEQGTVGDSLGSGSAASNEPVQDSSERESQLQFSKDALSPGGTSSSSGTSTSSGGGNGGVSVSALDSVVAVHFFDASAADWVCGERRVTLPTAPANDLLRPPQAG